MPADAGEDHDMTVVPTAQVREGRANEVEGREIVVELVGCEIGDAGQGWEWGDDCFGLISLLIQ